MAAKTGSSTAIALKIGTVFGTAVQGGTGDKLICESFDANDNAETLTSNSIGSGVDMMDEAQAGATAPTATCEQQSRYDDAGTAAEFLFWGGASVMSMGSGAYTHSATYNANRTNHYATIAWEESVGSIVEIASANINKLTIKGENPPRYLSKTFEMLGNNIAITGTTNTVSSIATTTIANSKKIVLKPEDQFEINLASAGALSTSDCVNIQSIEIALEQPLEQVREVKNAAGNGIPRVAGSPPFAGTVTVVLRNEQDFWWRSSYKAGTEFKAALIVTGDLIGGSQYYKAAYYFPRLKMLAEPNITLTNPGENTITLTFTCLAASTAPTGMINTLPYQLRTNTRATAYFT